MWWTSRKIQALLDARTEEEEDLRLFEAFRDMLLPNQNASHSLSLPSTPLWVGAGVVGLGLLAQKLLQIGQGFKLPTVTDIKEKLGLIPGPAQVETEPKIVAVTPAFVPPPKEELDKVQVTSPSAQVMDALKRASLLVGVDLGLLLSIAHQESRFNPNAKASGSSATGLFQIVSRTWKDLVARYGAQYDVKLGDIKDLEKNALMGALYVRDLMSSVQRSLGKVPSVTDVYAAFVLGPTGVRELFNALKTTPDLPAAVLFPSAAKSNKNLFYKPDGSPKTVSEFYSTLYGKVGVQYQKFSSQLGQFEPQLASVDPTFLPTPSQPSSTQPVQVAFSLGSSTKSNNTTPAQVVFQPPEKIEKDTTRKVISSKQEPNTSVGYLPDKVQHPVDYFRLSSGQLVAVTS